MNRKVIIVTGYLCNNNCTFCYINKKKQIQDKSLNKIKEEIRLAKKDNCTYLELNGGEVTIRKDIFKIISYAKQKGFNNISITSNGRMFSYPQFTKKMYHAGLNNIVFSIHGHTPKLHDSQTQVKGSFEQLLRGMRNAQKFKINISTNTTITKINYRYLPKIAEFIADLGIKNAEFIYVDPANFTEDEFNKLVPELSKIKPYLQRALRVGCDRGIKQWYARYIPACYLGKYNRNISELNELFTTKMFCPDFINPDVAFLRKNLVRRKTKDCIGCKYYSTCEGVWNAYLSKFKNHRFKAIK